jgi:hypothetical protein
MNNIPFWVLMPCISEIVRCFGGLYCLHLHDPKISQMNQQQRATVYNCSLSLLVSSLDYFLILIMNAICSPETSDSLQKGQIHNPEDSIVDSKRHDNLKSKTLLSIRNNLIPKY